MNKITKRIKDIFKISAIESKTIISWGNLVFVLLIVGLSILQIAFNKNISNNIPKSLTGTAVDDRIDQLTFANVSRVVSQVMFYSLISRVWKVLTDKSTIDKNRAAFMSFKKEDVMFGKVISDLILFVLPIILSAILAPIIVLEGKGGHFQNSEWIGKLAINIIGILFVYLITTIGMRYIWTANWKLWQKIISLVFWMLFTVGWMIIGSILFGVLKTDTESFVDANKYIFAFIPFMSCATPWLVFYGMLPEWTIVPSIIYSLIVTIVLWKWLSSSTKQYLCI